MSRIEVRPGDRFGRWTVLREGDRQGSQRRRAFWCECECGQVGLIVLHALTGGSSASCGCFQREGAAERARSPERRARLAEIGRSPAGLAKLDAARDSPRFRERMAELNRSPESRARASERARSPEHLARLAEFTRSPANRERVAEQFRTHGLSSHPLYHAHHSMMQRCHNPEHPTFADYGALGVTVTPEWHDPGAFITWIEANLGPRPGGTTTGGMPEYTLDRIDVLGHYEPGNVRWATWSEQNRNRRHGVEACDE